MSKVRLLRDSGAIQISSQEIGNVSEAEAPAVIEKDALLCYEGSFASMDGPVDITKETIRKIISNHNGFLMRLKRMVDDIGLHRYCPPLQLDHETKATHTVGRLSGELYEAPYTRVEDGKTVVGLYGRGVRVLGKENTIKVLDGRWVNLSIGADLETGVLSELTITPFPAAPEAKLLKDGTRMSKQKEWTDTYDGVRFEVWEDADKGTYDLWCDLKAGRTLIFKDKKPTREAFGIKNDVFDAIDKIKPSQRRLASDESGDTKMAKKQKAGSGTYRGINYTVYSSENKNEQGGIFFVSVDDLDWESNYKGSYTDAVSAAKKYIDESYKNNKLSSGGNMFKKLMAWLMFSDKLSKEQALSRLAESSDEDKKKLSEKADEEEKKLSDEDKEKLKKLAEDDESEEDKEKRLEKEKEDAAKLAAEKEESEKKDKELRGKLKKHLTETEKLSEEDAEEKLSKLSSEEVESAVKKHEEEYHKGEKKAQLSAASANLTKLSAQMRAKKDSARLASKAAKISVRLSSLRAEGKVTPAEIKKMDIKKLAAGSDAELAAYMKGFEDREPVILAGSMGSMKAVNLAKIEADKKSARMSSEMMGNMPFTKKALENTAKLSGNTSTLSRLAKEHEENQEDKEHHLSDVPSHKELCALVDGSVTDKEKADELKKHLGALCKYARASTIDGDKHLAESVDELEKHLSEIEETTAELEKAAEEVEKLSK